jgi:predicted O-methyltransferase YrrM
MKAKTRKLFSILQLIITLRFKRGKDIVDVSLGSPVLETIQVPSELRRFAEIVAAMKPRSLMEIGTNKGGTLCILSRLASPDAVIVSLDLPGGDFGGGYKPYHAAIFKHFTRAKQKLHLLRGDSHSLQMELAARGVLGETKLDLLFIDGDHTYEGVKKDFESYSPLVRPGGIVAFHDIVEHVKIPTCQVSRLWNEVKGLHRHEEIIESRAQGWAGIGVLYL